MIFSEMVNGSYYRITCDYYPERRAFSAPQGVNIKGDLVRIESFSATRATFKWKRENGDETNKWIGIQSLEPPNKNPK